MAILSGKHKSVKAYRENIYTKPTVGRIADMAGVSKATVSAIISGGGSNVKASEATRHKVFAIAEKLKYRPPVTHNIGVIHSVGNKDPEEIDWVGWVSPMLASIHTEAVGSNKLVSVFGHSSSRMAGDFYSQLPPIFKRKKIDGIIVSGILDRQLLTCLQRYRLPFVLMNVSDSHLHAEDAICFDEVFSGYQAARHLIDRGHRRVLYAGVNWSSQHYSVSQRQEGYLKALNESDLRPMMVHHETEDETLVEEVIRILKSPDRPTAIVAYNEIIAFCCYRAIFAAGMNFGDVSLIGIAWAHLAFMETMNLTCVALPARQMGTLAFKALLRKMASNETTPTVLLRGTIKQGKSVMPRISG